MSIIQEFKTFISRGNVIDLAVGVIIGGAFGKIVTSLVEDLINPVLGLALANVNLAKLGITIGGTEEVPVRLAYGNFIQSCITFLITGAAIFLLVKAINKFHKKEQAAPAPPAAPTKDQELLGEIRDLLKAKSSEL